MNSFVECNGEEKMRNILVKEEAVSLWRLLARFVCNEVQSSGSVMASLAKAIERCWIRIDESSGIFGRIWSFAPTTNS